MQEAICRELLEQKEIKGGVRTKSEAVQSGTAGWVVRGRRIEDTKVQSASSSLRSASV